MATYVWDKKDRGVGIQSVRYEIIKKCHKYTAGGGKCHVCLSEKLAIMKDRDGESLSTHKPSLPVHIFHLNLNENEHRHLSQQS